MELSTAREGAANTATGRGFEALVSRLRATPPGDPHASRHADRLRDALSQVTGEVIEHLLDDRSIATRRCSDGRPLRDALVTARDALGFPWALRIDPAELPLLSPSPPDPGGSPLVGVGLGLLAIAVITVLAMMTLGPLFGGVGHALQGLGG